MFDADADSLWHVSAGHACSFSFNASICQCKAACVLQQAVFCVVVLDYCKNVKSQNLQAFRIRGFLVHLIMTDAGLTLHSNLSVFGVCSPGGDLNVNCGML